MKNMPQFLCDSIKLCPEVYRDALLILLLVTMSGRRSFVDKYVKTTSKGLSSRPLVCCRCVHRDVSWQSSTNLSSTRLKRASRFRAEGRGLVVFLLDAVRVLVCVWKVIDASTLASVAVFLSGDEV